MMSGIVDDSRSQAIDLGYDMAATILRDDTDAVLGIYWAHPGCPVGEGPENWVPVRDDDRGWQLVSAAPLTLSPSLLCAHCRVHGFIRDGRWVPA